MGKSYTKQLREAIESGDTEVAKAILAKIEAKEKRNPEAKTARNKKKKNNSSIGGDDYEDTYKVKTRKQEEKKGRGREDSGEEKTPKKKFVNKYKDDGVRLPSKFDKIDQQINQMPSTVEYRQPAKKVPINCDICKRKFDVYPSEIMMCFDNNARSYTFYKCNACMGRNR